MSKVRFILILWLFAITVFATRSLKVAHITDVHFLSAALVNEKSEAYNAFVRATGRNIADLHEVFDVVLMDLANENIDILFISGDMTHHGERQSHLDFIEKTRPLKAQGTRIFVVPGNHDINIPDAKAFTGNTATPTPSVSPEEFTQLYADFGYRDAMKKDTHSLSYLSAINDTVWLLAFDTNRYAEHTTTSISSGRILPQTLAWALDILQEAREKGITVLGMMHHGLVEHIPYQSLFFSEYLIADWEKHAEILADAGLTVVFTGHFHSNDVSLRTSAKGNTIYDVETASLAQYPFAYRIMNLHDNKLYIDTRFVTSTPRNPNLEEKYRQKLETITRNVAQNRLRRLGIPMPDEMRNALVDIIVKLNMLHVRGDEKLDEEMIQAVHKFSELLGGDADANEFIFDFPPEDNQLVINLQKYREANITK
jgi:predicted MPP superfamily phosphohydrolase